MAIACPKCREPNVRRSHRQIFDGLLRSIGMVPLRCNVCEHRFFRFRRSLISSSGQPDDPASAIHPSPERAEESQRARNVA